MRPATGTEALPGRPFDHCSGSESEVSALSLGTCKVPRIVSEITVGPRPASPEPYDRSRNRSAPCSVVASQRTGSSAPGAPTIPVRAASSARAAPPTAPPPGLGRRTRAGHGVPQRPGWLSARAEPPRPSPARAAQLTTDATRASPTPCPRANGATHIEISSTGPSAGSRPLAMPAGRASRSATTLCGTPIRRLRQRCSLSPSPCQSAKRAAKASGASARAASRSSRQPRQSSAPTTRISITGPSCRPGRTAMNRRRAMSSGLVCGQQRQQATDR